MSRRRVTYLLALLGGVHVVMLLVGRLVLLETPWLLWSWFGVCVLAGGIAAAHIGGLPMRRGLAGAVGFVLGWVVIGPVVGVAFEHLLPERRIILGIALATQLLLLLPPAGVAWLWRLVAPLTVDILVSIVLVEARPPGVGGSVSVLGTLALVWLLETRVGMGRASPDGPATPPDGATS